MNVDGGSYYRKAVNQEGIILPWACKNNGIARSLSYQATVSTGGPQVGATGAL